MITTVILYSVEQVSWLDVWLGCGEHCFVSSLCIGWFILTSPRNSLMYFIYQTAIKYRNERFSKSIMCKIQLGRECEMTSNANVICVLFVIRAHNEDWRFFCRLIHLSILEQPIQSLYLLHTKQVAQCSYHILICDYLNC